ncbi:hypothetical protein L6164_010702 [Bauhinia variegata]|uniref:Uncharacterized protein n=1 Tax=Bauhinia variegata TaxID=167791 RepID=A0ACB9P4I7_BAUVA|nr:hypothetical protein L6164_010702 [Bauhinia variegata]
MLPDPSSSNSPDFIFLKNKNLSHSPTYLSYLVSFPFIKPFINKSQRFDLELNFEDCCFCSWLLLLLESKSKA